MTHFAGFAGKNEAVRDLLMRKAGPGAQCRSDSGVTVITGGVGGEPVSVAACSGTGDVTVRRGDPRADGGCSVMFFARGGTPPRIESDPFGQSRVFTARTAEGTVCFASDPRLLASLIQPALDADALKGYVCFSHVPQPRTLWSSITSLPPSSPTPWSSREPAESPPDADTIQSLLRAAVERRLTTCDVGVYLSGGLDSSLVAALLVEAGVRPRLFTLDFGPPFDAELPVARAVADHLGLTLTVVPARPRHIYRAVVPTARALPQPFGDSVTVPLWLLGQAARDQVAEVWNGEGGDQLFGGWANKPMIAALAHGDTSEEAERREYAETYHRFGSITDRLLTPALQTASAAFRSEDWLRPALDRDRHPTLLHRLRAANLALKGAQNIAPRMVALAECHGLRVRAPFFDTALTHATFALSPRQLLSGACEKYLLKQVAEKYLPPGVVWAQKRGMGVPSTEWCLRHGPLGWDIRRRLSPRRLRARGWFEPDLVKNLFRGEDPSAEGAFRRRRVGEKLWLLYLLEVWCEGEGN